MQQLATTKTGAEPHWRRAIGLRPVDLSAAMAEWLFDSASLTKRLRQAGGGDFSVRLLQQRFERPLQCERRALALDDRAFALVRQVHLCCGADIKVYARTVMPLTLLRGGCRRLAALGGRSLGEMLFRDASMWREPMQIARIDIGDLYYRWGVPGKVTDQVWGRRSVFHLSGRPLLVNEMFLPPVPEWTGFRVKQTI